MGQELEHKQQEEQKPIVTRESENCGRAPALSWLLGLLNLTCAALGLSIIIDILVACSIVCCCLLFEGA